MTRNKIIGLSAVLLIVGVGLTYAIAGNAERRPDFIAAEGASVSTLKWKGGTRYENVVSGRTVATLELAKISPAAQGGTEYEFRVVSSEPGVFVNFAFHVSPVNRLGGLENGFALCDLCGPHSAQMPFSPMYSVVW